MESIIFYVNTFYQLIVAMKIAFDNAETHTSDIIFTDVSTNYEEVLVRLRACNIFRHVYFLPIRKHIKGGKLHKAHLLVKAIATPLGLRKHFIDINFESYSKFYYYNEDIFSVSVCLEAIYKDNTIQFNKFEDGYSSYIIKNLRSGIIPQIDNVYKMRGMDLVKRMSARYWYFYPNLIAYKKPENVCSISGISKDSALKEIYNFIFDYSEEKNEYRDKKYIIFEESFSEDTDKVNDFDLIMRVVKYLGDNSMIVKRHPRNKKDRFSAVGVETNKITSMPWEIIELNNDFTNTVFLTISSSSVINSQLFFRDDVKTILLYNLLHQRPNLVNDEYLRYIDKIVMSGCDFHIPKSFDELKMVLEDEK